MATDQGMSTPVVQQRIDERLDAVDRALLGLLPRQERLAIVAQVEAKVRGLGADNPQLQADLPAATETAAASTGFVPARRARSRLAVTAGVLGIVALAMLFLTPVAWFMLAMLDGAIDEVLALAILGTQAGVFTLAGTAAVMLGIVALVQLSRRRGSLVGHGWAITGLCTGPVPMLIGGIAVLATGMAFSATSPVQVSYSAAPVVTSNQTWTPVPCEPCLPPAAMPGNLLPKPMPASDSAGNSAPTLPPPLPANDTPGTTPGKLPAALPQETVSANFTSPEVPNLDTKPAVDAKEEAPPTGDPTSAPTEAETDKGEKTTKSRD